MQVVNDVVEVLFFSMLVVGDVVAFLLLLLLVRLEALAVDDGWARLVVLLFGDPHLLEGG